MQFEGKHLFENALRTGINLFLGAGFSLLAKDSKGKFLPLGGALCDELKETFGISGKYNLVQVSSILEKTKRIELAKFLRERFTVHEFNQKYLSLNRLNIKSIFTTNIDDLIIKIFESNTSKFLHDVAHEGSNPNDMSSVDFSALHGSIAYNDRPLIFDTASIANTYSNSPREWSYLSNAIERTPTIFWGYSLSDSSVIQALTSRSTLEAAQRDKWIVIHKDEESTSEYFRSLGFKIIISNTEEFLAYLGEFQPLENQRLTQSFDEILYYFSRNTIPKSAVKLQARPISDFFMGNPPIWSDIYGGQVYKTSHFSKVQNEIFSKKNILVLGTPVSGKTTLMMQLAAFTEIKDGIKLLFNYIEKAKAVLMTKFLAGKRALLFIDNFTDSIDAVNYLSRFENIQLIGFDRFHQYGTISHKIEGEFEHLNVTQLSDQDIQGIYDSLPAGQRNTVLRREMNPDYEKDSIFEFISRNVKFPDIRKRYKQVLEQLSKKNGLLAEFLILSSYVHFTRTPLSFEMVRSYFDDKIDSYKDVFKLRDELGELIRDYSGELMMDTDQDYYYPRSIYSAETILDVANVDMLRNVIRRTLENVPTTQIPSYHIFRRRAYDKNVIGRAFVNWRDGMEFYEKVYINDFKNPYVLQQGALYLAQKNRFTDAFHWIDKALTLTNNKYFSIRNSHAIILFDANINSQEQGLEVRAQLDKSMEILEKCVRDDKRRAFHALRYGEQAIQYSDRYYDAKAVGYLTNALNWLRDEFKKMAWNYELSNLLRKVETRVRQLA